MGAADAPAVGYTKFRTRAHGYPVAFRKEGHGQYSIFSRPSDFLVRYAEAVGKIGVIRPIEDLGKYSSIEQALSVVDRHHSAQHPAALGATQGNVMPPELGMPKTKRQLTLEVAAILSRKPSRHATSSWGPVSNLDHPPVAGTRVDVDGVKYRLVPVTIRNVRSGYDRQFARSSKVTHDDAWFVVTSSGVVLELIVGAGTYWSLYRPAGMAGETRRPQWRPANDVEITYRRGIDGDWKSVVAAIARLAV